MRVLQTRQTRGIRGLRTRWKPFPSLPGPPDCKIKLKWSIQNCRDKSYFQHRNSRLQRGQEDSWNIAANSGIHCGERLGRRSDCRERRLHRQYCGRRAFFLGGESDLCLIDNPVNYGKGQSIRDGVRRATGDIILFADADNSTPIEDAEKLVQAIEEGADIAIGSRWVKRSLQVRPQPLHRRLNGRVYNLLLRGILGLDYKDTQNGFKAFTRSAAKTVFGLQKIGGWGFDAEVLYLAKKFGFKVREIPVEYTYFAEGSKIRPYRDGAQIGR